MSHSTAAPTPCPAELSAQGHPSSPPNPARQPPPCDFAEGRIWAALGGGWNCLHGCYCQCGISVEWHDFECAKPRDWARTFHPGSVEVCLNLSGHARLSDGNATVLMRSMTLGIYRAEGSSLAAWRLPGERHRFLTLEFSPGFLARHLGGHELALHPVLRSALSPSAAGPRIAPLQPLSATQRKWVDTVRDPRLPGPANRLWYESKALEIMASLFFSAGEPGDEPRTRRQSVAGERAGRVIEILGQRLTDPPSLKELGRLIGCSPFHLSRTFSQEMGMTLPQYLRQVRMERAAEMLKSGRFNVTEAALEVGYSSLSHFSQAFCEVMGCCPGLYPLGPLRRRT